MGWQDLLPWSTRTATPARDDRPALLQRLRETEDTLAFLQEDALSLRTELALDDLGWSPLGPYQSWQLSYAQLRDARARSRSMYLRNPLIHYAVDLQAIYVFGQGVSFVAQDPRVQAVVDAFLEDPANQAELTSHEARLMKERELQLDGDLFCVLFTDGAGAVRVRTIPPNEIAEIITNPDDAKEPWYYKRAWQPQTLNPITGLVLSEPKVAYYPDWRYAPASRLATIGQQPVEWDTPVYHRRVGGFSDMLFGVPETFAAQDWVLAHKKNLEDWASIVEALRKFAYQVKTPGGARSVQALKQKLGTTFAGGGGAGVETNPPPGTASTAVMTQGYTLEPVKTQGATASPSDSRQLRLMISAGVATPDHFFDADVGNYATAKTLDRPTELKFRNRQTLWASVFNDLFQYALDQRLAATNHRLGPVPVGGTDQLQTRADGALDRTVDTQFPPVLQQDLGELVAAVVSLITLEGHPPVSEALLRELLPYALNALGEDDVDAKLAALFPVEEPPAPASAATGAEPPEPGATLRDPAEMVPTG